MGDPFSSFLWPESYQAPPPRRRAVLLGGLERVELLGAGRAEGVLLLGAERVARGRLGAERFGVERVCGLLGEALLGVERVRGLLGAALLGVERVCGLLGAALLGVERVCGLLGAALLGVERVCGLFGAALFGVDRVCGLLGAARLGDELRGVGLADDEDPLRGVARVLGTPRSLAPGDLPPGAAPPLLRGTARVDGTLARGEAEERFPSRDGATRSLGRLGALGRAVRDPDGREGVARVLVRLPALARGDLTVPLRLLVDGRDTDGAAVLPPALTLSDGRLEGDRTPALPPVRGDATAEPLPVLGVAVAAPRPVLGADAREPVAVLPPGLVAVRSRTGAAALPEPPLAVAERRVAVRATVPRGLSLYRVPPTASGEGLCRLTPERPLRP